MMSALSEVTLVELVDKYDEF